MPERDAPLLAVLIDADNTSSKAAQAIFTEIATLGEAGVRRIYGDFSSPRLKSWSDQLAGLAIVAHQQFANTTGKNASDIALVIDAMDLLHSDRFDGFVLVSSDSDFTRLASRIREQGLDVYGIGERKTPEAFRRACKRFIFIENLLAAPRSAEGGEGAGETGSPQGAMEALPLIEKAIAALGEDTEWHNLGRIGQQLIASNPDFDPRNFGSSKLGQLIEQTGQFEVDRQASPARVRRAPQKERRGPRKASRPTKGSR